MCFYESMCVALRLAECPVYHFDISDEDDVYGYLCFSFIQIKEVENKKEELGREKRT